MGRADIDFALDLTAREGWGFLRKDLERLLALTPNGSFIARLDGRRVGLLTTICHGRCCWIGNVAVASNFRHGGIGRQLVRHALAFARTRGLDRTSLVCRQELSGFYRRLGFSAGRAIAGMSGTPGKRVPAARDASVVPVTMALLPRVARLDSDCCGDNRSAMLTSFWRDMRGGFLVHLDGKTVDGFIVGKPGAGAIEIGPWTARRGKEDAAFALFHALRAEMRGPVELYVPAGQRHLIRFLEDEGLRVNHLFREMGIGGPRPPAKEARMLAIAGLEKG